MQSAARWLGMLALVLYGAAFAAEDLTPEKRADIRRLIALTGGVMPVSQVADGITQNLAATLRKSRPDIPDRVFATVNRDVAALLKERIDAPGGLADRLTALYHQNFTHAEVKQLIAFYETPSGRRTMEVQSKLVSEAITETYAWARALSPEINRRVEAVLKQEGISMPRRK